MTSPGDKTLAAYQNNAQQYVDHSSSPGPTWLRFLDSFIDEVRGTNVLELGTGPGWDADYLESRGLRVTRTDAAAAFVERLRLAGHHAQLLDIRNGDLGGPYDAIWANAVLLHLSRDELENLLRRARRVVGETGVFGFTLKEGTGEAWSNAKLDSPRHFTFWREPALRELLSRTGWTVESLVQVDGRSERWLQVLARNIDPLTFEVISPASDVGQAILSQYIGDIAGRYYGRVVSASEIAQFMLDDPSDDLAAPTGLLIGAFIGDRISGCIGLRSVGNGIGEITRVYAAPECRGRGIGTKLIEQVEAHAHRLRLRQLRLDTRSDLVEARRLYARLGYSEVPAFNTSEFAEHWFAKLLIPATDSEAASTDP